MVTALCFMSSNAEGLQWHIIAGATCDASQQAVGVHGVTFGMTSGWCQCCDIGPRPWRMWPCDVRHGLGHLFNGQSLWTTGSWRERRGTFLYRLTMFNYKYLSTDVFHLPYCTCFQGNGVAGKTLSCCGGSVGADLIYRSTGHAEVTGSAAGRASECVGVTHGDHAVVGLSVCSCPEHLHCGRVHLSHVEDHRGTGSWKRTKQHFIKMDSMLHILWQFCGTLIYTMVQINVPFNKALHGLVPHFLSELLIPLHDFFFF